MILDSNEMLSGGLERIPQTVMYLSMSYTNLQDVTYLGQLINLETLNLDKNSNLVQLPDLSKLNKLCVLNVSHTKINHLPNLPLNLDFISLPKLKQLLTKTQFNKCHTVGNCLVINRRMNAPMDEIIQRIARINHFRVLREELLEQAAKITMNPKRIARLLESGVMEFDQVEELDNLFNYQTSVA